MPKPAPEIPAFALYGEAVGDSLSLHIETIAARSAGHGWRIGAHRHRGLHQALWVSKGRVRASLGAEAVDAEGPLAILVPPGVAHAFAFSPDVVGYVLTFDPRALVEGQGGAGAVFADLFAHARVLPANEAFAPRLDAALADLAAEWAEPGAALSPAPIWLARAALWRLARLADVQQRPGGARATFLRFVALVETRYREGWPVARYAAALGLSVKRLNRLTRAETGASALACIHARAIREACERLAHLDASVAAIGYDLGFDDPAYFTRFFKRMTGQSPSAFRERRG